MIEVGLHLITLAATVAAAGQLAVRGYFVAALTAIVCMPVTACVLMSAGL